MKHLARVFVTLSVALSVLVGAPARGAEQPAVPQDASVSRAKPTYWEVPEPFGVSSSTGLVQASWRGTKARFQLQVGAGSAYRFRSFEWTRWGRDTVIGKGRAAFCNYRGCARLTPARIVLKRRVGLVCGDADAPTSFYYSRYGFTHRRQADTFRAPGVC